MRQNASRSVSLKVIVNIDQNVSGYSQFAYAPPHNFTWRILGYVCVSSINFYILCYIRVINAKTLKVLIIGCWEFTA